MNDYIIGQITIFAGNFAPRGWMFCDGQLLNINNYPYLFTVIGTTYGDDSKGNFALPDLRGAAVVHPKSQYLLGTKGGDAEKNFSPEHFPLHHHTVNATIKSNPMAGNQNSPVNHYPANAGREIGEYHKTYSETSMAVNSVHNIDVSTEGSSHLAPLSNMQPYLAVNFIIKVAY